MEIFNNTSKDITLINGEVIMPQKSIIIRDIDDCLKSQLKSLKEKNLIFIKKI